MGGKAFASAAANGQPTIRTPRMTPAQYAMLRDILTDRLQKCFPSTYVGTMIEAPEKESYGDLDFIIASNEQVCWDELAGRIGATAILSGSQGVSVAVRLDGHYPDFPTTKPIRYHSTSAPSPQMSTDEYAQVDLTLIHPSEYHWWQFYASYGDLNNILGFVVRKLGLTISDKGLFLRHELLDDAKGINHLSVSDKHGMLFLSNDPTQVMTFLGLDPIRWEDGFTRMKDLFAWLAECRLLTREILDSSKERDSTTTSRHRQKERKRTIFPDFLYSYCEHDIALPSLPTATTIASPELRLRHRRAYVQDEAIAFFNLHASFISHFQHFHKPLVNQHADHLIKPLLADLTGKTGRGLAEVLRGLRRWTVIDDTGMPAVSTIQMPDEDSQLSYFLGADLATLDEQKKPMLETFIVRNWERIKQLERHGD